MGQKINPIGFRLAVQKNWASRWYSNSKNFPTMLQSDIKVREFLKKKLANAAVSRVLIERPAKNAKITIHSARPGVVIGKKGEVLKRAGTLARQELEELLESKVFLECYVKTQKGWRDNASLLQEFGYNEFS